MNQDQAAPDNVLVYVEQEGANKFKIESRQLEQIGAKLRGRRRFSVFNSIILPLIVSVATIVFSSFLQYVSWLNSVRLQNANDNAVHAAQTYEKAASAIGKRSYATLVFLPALRDLGRSQPAVPTTEAGPAPVTASGAGASPLAKLDGELRKQRFDSYYELLRNWNENYDQIITAIDYDLDRPVLLQAEVASEGVQVSDNKIRQIDCTQQLTGQLIAHKLNRDSLKLQFAVIHSCFTKVHALVDGMKSGVLARDPAKYDEGSVKKIRDSLGDLHTMANEFRCYALRRIDFYKRQKEKSIVNLRRVIERLVNIQKMDEKSEATAHFSVTAERCAQTLRVAAAPAAP
jgi:hypothetical protein